MSTSTVVRNLANDVAYIRGVQEGSDWEASAGDVVDVISHAARATGGGVDHTLIKEIAESYREGIRVGNDLRLMGCSTKETLETIITAQVEGASETSRKERDYWQSLDTGYRASE